MHYRAVAVVGPLGCHVEQRAAVHVAHFGGLAPLPVAVFKMLEICLQFQNL